jgi:thiamine-monophosphate kinase
MDERHALESIGAWLPAAGDDAAVVGTNVLTTDMLHASTDFPAGVDKYTAGWRSVGASLSDVAAMGAEAAAAVAVYAAPEFDERELSDFLAGASDVCQAVGAEYVGGDLDTHEEFTVSTTALGRVDSPVRRSGAMPGDRVFVTGTLGRSALALSLFEAGETNGSDGGGRNDDESDDSESDGRNGDEREDSTIERANDLFRFTPRVAAGVALGSHASAMMDISDGLARSLHQLATASDCGFKIESPLPIDDRLFERFDSGEARYRGTTFGEDFELLITVPESAIDAAEARSLPVEVTEVGRVVTEGISFDGEGLPDRGYTHG